MTRTYVVAFGILATVATHRRPVETAMAMISAGLALLTAALILGTARCPSGCFCVKDRFVWRCVTCHHICHHDEEVTA